MSGNETSQRPGYGDGRDALLRAAARVVARGGFGALTYRAVAEEAGITHTLVAYHFGSRDNLIHEAIVKAVRDAIRDSSVIPQSGRLEDFARDLSRVGVEASEEQAFQFELLLEARRRRELLPEAQAMYEEYFRAVNAALAELGVSDDPIVARVVFATLDGLMLQQLLFERADETDESMRALISMLELLRDAKRGSERSAHPGRSAQQAPR